MNDALTLDGPPEEKETGRRAMRRSSSGLIFLAKGHIGILYLYSLLTLVLFDTECRWEDGPDDGNVNRRRSRREKINDRSPGNYVLSFSIASVIYLSASINVLPADINTELKETRERILDFLSITHKNSFSRFFLINICG